MIVWNKEKVDSFRPVEPNTTNPSKPIIFKTLSKGYYACDKDIKDMSNKLRRLLVVVNDWGNDADIAVSFHKFLAETIKSIQSDVDFFLRVYRIEDEKEKSDLTKEITELINKATIIIKEEH